MVTKPPSSAKRFEWINSPRSNMTTLSRESLPVHLPDLPDPQTLDRIKKGELISMHGFIWWILTNSTTQNPGEVVV
jgi:hypothetical protein